jgi:hypothetical protein
MATASHEAIVNLINGLFKTRHPPGSKVDFPNTVIVNDDLKQIVTDIEILIDEKHLYHIEAEIDNNLNIALRMFRYGYERGLKRKTAGRDGVITIPFPKARVLYWETTKNTLDTARLRLIFPDGTPHEFSVGTFKVLEHSPGDLAKRKLLLLLPFYILKLRKQVVAAKTSAKRRALSGELGATFKQIVETLDAAEQSGILTKPDKQLILNQLDILFSQIYEPYKEFKEVTKMKDTVLLSRFEQAELKAELTKSLEIAKNLLVDGLNPERVAKATKLPLAKVKALLKNLNAKQTA